MEKLGSEGVKYTKQELIEMLKVAEEADPTIKIYSPSGVNSMLAEFADKKQEHFVVITLNGSNMVIRKQVVFVGTVNASLVHPREVFALALEDRAAAIIVAHNHPSGSLTPSREDNAISERLKKCGELMGIEVLDHVICSKNGFFSFRESNML